ncbi:MAG: DUF3352 domain-containing protein [Leptolyngbya sp. SIO1E4]|nr:DUF3352 domain-containing protein [Leptolyngbya sp. SIO1E4]
MKSRTFFSAIALVAGLLLLVGIAGFWGLTAQNPRGLMARGGQEIPTAAQFVPRQAPLMVSLLARPDRVWRLRQVLTPSGKRSEARQEWQSLKTTLTDAVGWDYDTDVLPWLDQEVTIAVTTTDLDHDSGNGQQAGYLAVLSCQDGQQAREAVHLLWQKRAISGRSLFFETVSGIPLIYDQKPDPPVFGSINVFDQAAIKLESLASVVIGDRYVLLANHPQVLRQAIATFQAPDVSLAKESTYRASIKALPSNRIGWLYANAPALLTWLGLEDPELTSSLAESGRRAHHFFMSFRAIPTGLLGDTTVAAAPGTAFKASQAIHQPSKILNILPAETLFAASGINLPEFLPETAENIGGYRIVQRSLKAFLASLSLPSDITPSQLWDTMQGEYALGLIAGRTPTWILASQSNPEVPFSALDDLAQQQGLNVSHVRLGDKDITAWTQLSLILTAPDSPASLNTQVIGVHTQISDYEVFSTSLAGLQQVLKAENESSLPEQPGFAKLLNNLDEPYGNLAYIDWPHLAPLLFNRFPWLRVIEQAGQPLTAHLGPIFMGGYGSNSSLQEGMVAIKLLENP